MAGTRMHAQLHLCERRVHVPSTHVNGTSCMSRDHLCLCPKLHSPLALMRETPLARVEGRLGGWHLCSHAKLHACALTHFSHGPISNRPWPGCWPWLGVRDPCSRIIFLHFCMMYNKTVFKGAGNVFPLFTLPEQPVFK